MTIDPEGHYSDARLAHLFRAAEAGEAADSASADRFTRRVMARIGARERQRKAFEFAGFLVIGIGASGAANALWRTLAGGARVIVETSVETSTTSPGARLPSFELDYAAALNNAQPALIASTPLLLTAAIVAAIVALVWAER